MILLKRKGDCPLPFVYRKLNPLSPNSVQQQFSPNDIHTLS